MMTNLLGQILVVVYFVRTDLLRTYARVQDIDRQQFGNKNGENGHVRDFGSVRPKRGLTGSNRDHPGLVQGSGSAC